MKCFRKSLNSPVSLGPCGGIYDNTKHEIQLSYEYLFRLKYNLKTFDISLTNAKKWFIHQVKLLLALSIQLFIKHYFC